jgi:hypothetical protein
MRRKSSLIPIDGFPDSVETYLKRTTGFALGRPRAVTAAPTPGLADVDRGPRGWPTPVLRRARSAR